MLCMRTMHASTQTHVRAYTHYFCFWQFSTGVCWRRRPLLPFEYMLRICIVYTVCVLGPTDSIRYHAEVTHIVLSAYFRSTLIWPMFRYCKILQLCTVSASVSMAVGGRGRTLAHLYCCKYTLLQFTLLHCSGVRRSDARYTLCDWDQYCGKLARIFY